MSESLALLDASLERAAEAAGDLTAPVLAVFYAHHPDARAAFARHGGERQPRLEAEMVETALYCAMGWVDRRREIEIILANATPHHQETLGLPVAWFSGLTDALVATVLATIPADASSERALWVDIGRGLNAAILAARSTRAAA